MTSVAGVAAQQIQLKWAEFGLWRDGDTVLSIPESSPMYDMGQFDRVVALNTSDQFSSMLVHGAQDERLMFPVHTIDRVFWLGNDREIVEGSIPKVNADGTLEWDEEGRPPPGRMYTISGSRHNEYYCWGQYPGNRHHHHGARLPRRVVLRLMDLFGRDT